MEEKQTALIVVKENFIEKAKTFFSKVFFKIFKNDKKNIIKNKENIEAINKKEFFKKYNKIKNGEIHMSSLNLKELYTLEKILTEEYEIKSKEIKSFKNSLI